MTANPPGTMQVIAASRPGGPQVLAIESRPVPVPSAGEVLIEVAAAGLNRADLLQRRGAYPPPPGAADWPGLEVSGTVVAVAGDVAEFAVGDAVCALLPGGGYAQYCAVPVGQVLRVPAGIDLVEAAALPEAYFTVWSNVFEFGRLAPGESLLVHGGSSGIGVAAIQLGAALGHPVFTTAGSDDKCRFCESLGARLAINYRKTDFVKALATETGGRGVDVILDMVGADYLSRNLDVLAVEGRLVVIAVMSGATAPADLLKVMLKRLTITGSTLRPRSVAFKTAMKAKLLEHVWPLLASGKLRPIVDRVFAFGDAAAAHAHMEAGGHMGKILLDCRH